MILLDMKLDVGNEVTTNLTIITRKFFWSLSSSIMKKAYWIRQITRIMLTKMKIMLINHDVLVHIMKIIWIKNIKI